ncbi:MAG: glutamate--tRNA ligase [Kiritimatiellia bacterium]|jgi:glutamyl-tRNA synthetase|nr:glutamate--tRNA ligase [Kiritimatiellia bacterium]MDD4174103.1 glutamate--tRNA ligase [Kiritimatiellia bacterium]MDD4442554.1 glutamate--tRNA ligase [Kiritimatiellia bacterium]NLC82940.1 glutamate--tRNA ligase [Lentisphaerota bacterium]
MSVRVRFAPSPTGNVHIGNIRAAIFNWLFARHAGGKFLLRVEDTDRERSTQAAIDTLLDCMGWLGLDYDEPEVYQSRQMARHLAVAEDLVNRGLAYKDNKGGGGECVIFRMPKEGRLEYTDLVKGTIKKKAEDTQDFVIVRSDGTPVFHLSNVVDDIDMGITHVIRGDDHVENTFKHIELFKALGAPVPNYAHLPMIVNNQGKPYSKRDGAAFVGEFKEQGYLPDALFNFLLLLGWAPGDDREVLTRAEMIELFTLERCKSSAARFDLKKLVWMNGEYIRRQPREVYAAEFTARIQAAGLPVAGRDLAGILDQMQIRTKFYSEIPGSCAYFFTEEYPFDEKGVAKRLKAEGVPELLEEVAQRYEALPSFDVQSTHDVLAAMGETRGSGLGAMVHPVRVAVSGLTEGPGLFEMLALIGREPVCARLRRVARRLRDGTLGSGT